MSHSQFHSTNLFILRHAWLNLWDKHMTTGRINQVTTFPTRCELYIKYSASHMDQHLSSIGVHFLIWKIFTQVKNRSHESYWCSSTMELRLPCSPISHCSDALLLVSSKQKLWSSKRTACDQQSISPNHGGSSSVLIAYKLSYQQVVHIPHSLQAQKDVLDS